MFSRRNFIYLLGPIAAVAGSSTPCGGIDKHDAVSRKYQRRYRADAIITLLGLPVYSRAGVGAGYAVLAEESGPGCRVVSLSFAGGSWPQRAAGLNRVGLIEEIVRENAQGPFECDYLGFMTSSPEGSLAQAKQGVSRTAGATSDYAAIRGSSKQGGFRSLQTHFSEPANLTFANWRELIGRVRAQMDKGGAQPAWSPVQAGGVLCPLLYVLMRATRAPGEVFENQFVYGQSAWQLRTETMPDAPMRERFAGKALVRNEAAIMRLQDLMRELSSGKEAKFKIWFERGQENGLPLRIELQPRSFLHLVFECDPSIQEPPVASLLTASTEL